MRLDINLASQPYEDARQFWMRWGTALVAVSVLTLALLTIAVTGWFAARRDHAKIAQLRASIAQRDAKRQQAEQFLARPENRSTRDQSQFLNELIERKSFSWTRVLEDLEKVMPARVHLVSIHPELDDDNQLKLKMSVAGDSRDRALELARRQHAPIFQLRAATDLFALDGAPSRHAVSGALSGFSEGSSWPEVAPARAMLE